ncbi:hypothetical protein GCM10029964_091660 [Kibdelosporangium lantanae]
MPRIAGWSPTSRNVPLRSPLAGSTPRAQWVEGHHRALADVHYKDTGTVRGEATRKAFALAAAGQTKAATRPQAATSWSVAARSDTIDKANGMKPHSLADSAPAAGSASTRL